MAGRKETAYFDQAERLFVREGKTLEQLAALLPVSVTTLGKWSQKGGWGKKRAAELDSPRTLGERLRRTLEAQLTAIEGERELKPGDFDSIYKIFCAIQKIEKGGVDLRVMAVEVMDAFTRWLRDGAGAPPGELQMIGGRIREWFRSLE